MAATTPGLVCAHHHLYSALARGMPAPPQTPRTFLEILEQVWWRLDAALDLEMLRAAARLGALEALACGTTAIVDHHESPTVVEGSLDVIAEACAEVGVRVRCCYGVTDRWDGAGVRRSVVEPSAPMTGGARAGLAECERFLRAGGQGHVGVHAAFTCGDQTLEAAAGLARDLGVGVHVHVAEGEVDRDAARRLAPLATDDWLLVHCVHLDEPLPGTVAHNPRSNMNNAVGYARPRRFEPGQRVVLGTDGIGADMLEEVRLAYVRAREDDLATTPEDAWRWLANGWDLVPEARHDDVVVWVDDGVDDPWRLAFTTGTSPRQVRVGGEVVWADGAPTRVDAGEVRAHAAEQAARLFARL